MLTYNKSYLIEIAENCANVEIYEYKSYEHRSVHTDSIDFLDMSIDSLPEEVKCDFYEMDEDEYNRTIYANCGERDDFDELYDDKDAKVLVIVLQHNWNEE